jgi:hypothetical protein
MLPKRQLCRAVGTLGFEVGDARASAALVTLQLNRKRITAFQE